MPDCEHRAVVRADYLLAVSAFVSTEEGRPYLQGVYITPHPIQGVRLDATDGHMLAVIHDAGGRTTGLAQIWRVPARELTALIRSNKQVRSVGTIWCELGWGRDQWAYAKLVLADTADEVLAGNGVELGRLGTDGPGSYRIDGHYPDVFRLFQRDKNTGKGPAAWFRSEYLARIATFGKRLNGLFSTADVPISFEVAEEDKDDTTLVKFLGHPEALMLLMPTDRKTPVAGEPAWLTAYRSSPGAAQDEEAVAA